MSTITPSPLAGDSRPFAIDVLDRDERFTMAAYQGFLTGVKGFWRTDLYASVAEQAKPLSNQQPAEIEAAMGDDPSYYLYAWLERRLQQMKYAGRWGLMTKAHEHEADIDRLVPAELRDADAPVPPGYVADIDVHQHPGGLWSSRAAAVAHEWYQTGTSFSGVGTDTMVDHFVGTIARLTPKGGKVLDLACTLGRMSMAMKRAMPESEVIGLDVSGPAIEVARAKAAQAGLDVGFEVVNVEKLPYADASIDTIGNHWLFHEMPIDAIGNVLDETMRVLKPGGATVIFDMNHTPGGAIGLWLHMGYSARNNEPFGPGYALMDMRAELTKRGFVGIEMWNFNPEDASLTWVDELSPRRTHINTVILARKAS